MGIQLGLDFGTTTSILSFLDGSDLRTFFYGGYSARTTPYIPSVVAYLPDDLLIGPDATESWLPEASYYRYFKMLLPEEDKAKWRESYGPFASESLVPAEVTADFIGELITGDSPRRRRLLAHTRNPSAFQAIQREKIEGLVVSVPQVWSNWRARGRQQLHNIMRDLGLDLKQLISEPVAAAAYFLHQYRKIQTDSFYGNLLICDMGGGTFDVTLCKLAENRVEVLCNAGNGESGLGMAGAHFDHLLLSKKLDPATDPRVILQLLLALDVEKKSTASQRRLLACLRRPYEIPITPIYSVAAVSASGTTGHSFNYADIDEAFRPVREGIVDVLTRVKHHAATREYPIDKVVMVGGFSRFPLVQQAIAKSFEEDIFENRSLVDLDTLNNEEMAFAVSYGACLVANERVEIAEKYDHTISAMTYNSSGATDEEELKLITAGVSLDALDDAVYCAWPDGGKRRFNFHRDSAEVSILIRHLGSLAEAQKISRRFTLDDIPGAHVDENRWYLGARVDASKIPYLVLKDEKLDTEKEYPLGDLIPHAF